MQPWIVGTCTLISVIIGSLIGFLVNQAPLVIACAVAVGTGLDAWLHYRRAI